MASSVKGGDASQKGDDQLDQRLRSVCKRHARLGHCSCISGVTANHNSIPYNLDCWFVIVIWPMATAREMLLSLPS